MCMVMRVVASPHSDPKQESGYLVSEPDFGCMLWEAKEQPGAREANPGG